jgi:hypothetical protein
MELNPILNPIVSQGFGEVFKYICKYYKSEKPILKITLKAIIIWEKKINQPNVHFKIKN